jgi:hypothetical protein
MLRKQKIFHDVLTSADYHPVFLHKGIIGDGCGVSYMAPEPSASHLGENQ